MLSLVHTLNRERKLLSLLQFSTACMREGLHYNEAILYAYMVPLEIE